MKFLITVFFHVIFSADSLADSRFQLSCSSLDNEGKVKSQMVLKIDNKYLPLTPNDEEWKSVLFMPPNEFSVFYFFESDSYLNFGYAYLADDEMIIRLMDRVDPPEIMKILAGDKTKCKEDLLKYKNKDGKTLLDSSRATLRLSSATEPVPVYRESPK